MSNKNSLRIKHNDKWMIREYLCEFTAEDILDSLEDTIALFEKAKSDHPNHIDLFIDEDWGYYDLPHLYKIHRCGRSYTRDDNYLFSIGGYREETTREKEKRLIKYKKTREKKIAEGVQYKEKEIKQLKELYNKYGQEVLNNV